MITILPARTKLVDSTASGHCKDETPPRHIPVRRRSLCCSRRLEDPYSGKESGYPPCQRLPVHDQCRHECNCQHTVRRIYSHIPRMFDLRGTFLRPPVAVLGMVSTLATKTHKTLHHAETDEIMV